MLNSSFNVVTYGEVLWDVLPTGHVPGGAPMNVAYHLHKTGQHPALITRIGNDDLGTSLKDYFSNLGVCTDYFQQDELLETGKVFAHLLPNNEVAYDIVSPSAWDFIVVEDRLIELVKQSSYFIYGSLASRSNVSAETLLQLLAIAPIKVLDLNLRKPHFERPLLEQLLQTADILKLNEAELEFVTSWFAEYSSIEERVQIIRKQFGIQHIVVTLGSKGAYMWMNNQSWWHEGYVVEVEDTIGSGDAFLAGMISQMIAQETPDNILDFACKLGAFIATQKGACPEY
jgi:fructokinase